jgi:hypothetical protein
MNCPICLTSNPETATVCQNCGRALAASPGTHFDSHNGDGTVIQGEKNTAVGENGVLVKGDVDGDVITGIKWIINVIQNNTGVTLVVVLAVVVVAIVAIVALFLNSRDSAPSVMPPTASNVPTATILPPSATLPPTQTSLPITATPTLPACSFQAGSDEDTLRGLIQLEGKALANKDLSIIERIFAPNAFIGDAADKTFWNDPSARYQTYFDSIQSAQVTRTEIQPIPRGILENSAWFVSDELTELTFKDGSQKPFPNKPSSNHWAFAKNALGCWAITSLVFNASHYPFPCYCDLPSDDESLRCLIQAESQAVVEKNPVLIWTIFAPAASIRDGDLLLSSDPLNFYVTQRFQKYDYTHPEHFDLTRIEIGASEAFYTSGSRGSFQTPEGTPGQYDNPNPADHWQFQRNAAGCWAITNFAFNQGK